MIQTLVNNLDAQVSAALPGFQRLAFTVDPGRNTFRGANSRYGIRPRAANQASDSTQALFIDQQFTLTLANSFGMAATNDTAAIAMANDLQSKLQDVFSRLVATKAGSPNQVLRVFDLTMTDPVYDLEQKLVLVEASFTLKYRV